MKLIERYIFGQIFYAFFMTLTVLTGILWLTQALRELDLVTGKGQGLGIFLTITMLSMPLLILVIAPVALMIAFVYTLNKLNGDSELVVMKAAGISRWRLFRPFALLAFLVMILVGAMSLHYAPVSQQTLRHYVAKVRADLISNVMREGEFATVVDGLVFHVRDRDPGGLLTGIFVSDARDPEAKVVYLAERGQIHDTPSGTYLVMLNGTIQRSGLPVDGRPADPTVIEFDQYAFDLSKLKQAAGRTFFKARERSTAFLLTPDKNDPLVKRKPGTFRAELHQRLVNPIYAIALGLIVFACLGVARTSRQSRGLGIALAILIAGTVRVLGFASINLTIKSSEALVLVYGIPAIAIIGSLIAISGVFRFRLPRRLLDPLDALAARAEDLVRGVMAWLSRRLSTA